jgi:hypothetical protein
MLHRASGESLEAVTVLGDGDVPLHDPIELRFKVHNTCHRVINEDIDDERPRLLHGLVFRHDEVKDLIKDGIVQSGPHDVVLVGPLKGVSVYGEDGVHVVALAENKSDYLASSNW